MDIFIAIGLLLVGGTVLIAGGEILVRGATLLAEVFRIPQLVVGLTIVAACTGAPELVISLMSCFKSNGSPDLAIGNVVGSNICNVLLILGVASLIRPLDVLRTVLKRDFPLMIFLSAVMFGFAIWMVRPDSDSQTMIHYLPQWLGAILILIYAYYNYRAVRAACYEEEVVPTCDSGTVKPPVPETINSTKAILFALFLLAIGIIMLIAGSDWFINGAVMIAELLKIDQLIIGLTVLALGTSLPELAVSVIAVCHGKTDLAIGNVVGSNIFNIAIVLGGTALLVPGGISVTQVALGFDIPVMIAVALLGWWFCYSDEKVSRFEGVTFLICYILYIGCLVLK